MIKVQSQVPEKKMEYLIISLEKLNNHLEKGNLEIISHITHFNELKIVGNLDVKIKSYK